MIRQGDYLASLAHQFSFDANAVRSDPKNATFRQLRPDPNILYPTDILYIPDQNGSPTMKTLATGTTNTFVSDAPSVTVTHQFAGVGGSTYACAAYTVQELEQLTVLVTDENGVATFKVPVTLDTATVVFTKTGESCPLSIGALDPIDTLSGIFARLQNLGYILENAQFDPTDLDFLRVVLLTLKTFHPGSGDRGAGGDSGTGGSSGPTDVAQPSGTPPVADGDGSYGGDEPVDSDGKIHPDSERPEAPSNAAGDPNDDSGTGVSSSSSDDPQLPLADAGLSDDGKLSDEITKLLLQAHGC